MIASSDVDAVYIPLPTGLRKEWVLRAAAAGKHVLCEKPCGLSLADVREMTDACQKNRVQFMDGVMFMHNPRLRRLREVLDDGKTIGPIRRIMSVFTFAGGETFFDANIRVHAALEPTGLPRRSRLVLHPFRALGHELAIAPRSHWQDPLRPRQPPQPIRHAGRFFRRIDFRRRRIVGFLLFIPRPISELGPCQRRKRLVAPGRFCSSGQHP